jgi:zinc protease
VRLVKRGEQGDQATQYGDYREVNGIKFPYKIDEDQGEFDLDMKVQSVKVNSGLTAADLK